MHPVNPHVVQRRMSAPLGAPQRVAWDPSPSGLGLLGAEGELGLIGAAH